MKWVLGLATAALGAVVLTGALAFTGILGPGEFKSTTPIPGGQSCLDAEGIRIWVAPWTPP